MSESNPDRCPFCAVPPDRMLDASDHAFVVHDAYPVTRGHTLIISRRHVTDIFDLTEAEIDDFFRLLRTARERIDRAFRPSGYNVGVNIGRDAGQTIMHVHVHIIPRYSGDCDDPTGGVRGIIPGKARYPRDDPA
jgi:diadenosine tetraphosphate (Ap4A) HIT family hydrolase